jgi:hypothetical protein
MIFGGLVPTENIEPAEEEDIKKAQELFEFEDNGARVTLTKQTIILDVTVGSIKFGPELPTPSYFIGGGYKLTHNNAIYAFGHGVAPLTGLASLAAEAKVPDGKSKVQEFSAGVSQHKKYLHSYKMVNSKWGEVNETIFNGQRRDSDLNDDTQ